MSAFIIVVGIYLLGFYLTSFLLYHYTGKYVFENMMGLHVFWSVSWTLWLAILLFFGIVYILTSPFKWMR